MTVALVLDVIIAVLLVLTIVYAMRLNGRLTQLRKDKSELEALAKTFAEATVRADAGIKKLKISTESLKDDVHKAEVLKDDLVYLIQRGGASADELMERVNVGRGAPRTGHEPVSPIGVNGDNPDSLVDSMAGSLNARPQQPSVHERAHDPQSDAERVLMKVLGAAG